MTQRDITVVPSESKTPLGPIDARPQSLRTTVNTCLGADLLICRSANLPADQIRQDDRSHESGSQVAPFVEEALRWLPADGVLVDFADGDRSPSRALERSQRTGADGRPLVLVADDNADMRQYVVRILAEQFRVEAVQGGVAALAAARTYATDLVLTDVMMPRLDGFGLLQALRTDSATRSVPLIMLSARAGEDSKVEGMEAGADDYLVKPYSARKLLARVSAHVKMARMPRQDSASLREGDDRLRMALTAARMVAW